jgi:hypothetical protein
LCQCGFTASNESAASSERGAAAGAVGGVAAVGAPKAQSDAAVARQRAVKDAESGKGLKRKKTSDKNDDVSSTSSAGECHGQADHVKE